jgi:hypothetical protein
MEKNYGEGTIPLGHFTVSDKVIWLENERK